MPASRVAGTNARIVMGDGHGDLLPLFLDEARDRLLQLNEAFAEQSPTPDNLRRIRRELHALKGASRMMGLEQLSNLCHRAESQLERPTPESFDAAARIGVEMAAQVENLALGATSRRNRDRDTTEASSETSEDAERRRRRGSSTQASLRVTYPVVDLLTEAAAGVGIHADAGLAALGRVSRLTEAAAAGAASADPHQVLAAISAALRHEVPDIEALMREIKRLGRDQLDELLRLQVYSLRPFLDRMSKHAKNVAAELGKSLKVVVSAGKTQLDRRIVGALEAGFLHLVHNAVDHGIESSEERTAAGKPGVGRLEMRAVSEGDRARISIVDDGRGLDPGMIAEVAIRRGLVSSDEVEAMPDAELQQLVFRPGFSTREEASDISGRGIGMDAVAAAVRAVGGDMHLFTTPGKGTRVEIDVPITRRGERILVVRIGDAVLGIPAASVRGFDRLRKEAICRGGDRWAVRIGSATHPLVRIGPENPRKPSSGGAVVVLSTVGSRVALAVDGVLGEEEVLARPLSPAVGFHEVFESMALLAEGRPVPIISTFRLESASGTRNLEPSEYSSERRSRVLLVDDSRVTREMLRRVLLDAGFEVVAVASVGGAFDSLNQARFDCVLTDIEMPGKDGLELTRHIRAHAESAQMPIIVVSTRNRAEDRLAGLEAGADVYLTKQNLDVDELVTLIRRFGAGDEP